MTEPRGIPPRGKRWTQRETDLLLRQYGAGDPISGIAQRLGRPETSITNRLHYLRRTRDPRLVPGERRSRTWTTTEDQALDRLLAGSAELDACSAALGRSAGGVVMREPSAKRPSRIREVKWCRLASDSFGDVWLTATERSHAATSPG